MRQASQAIVDRAFNVMMEGVPVEDASLEHEPRTELLARSEYLDTISDALFSRIQVERMRLRVAYNSGSPINRLPMEVLSEIFLLQVPPSFYSREYTLRSLSAVCKVWKEVVLRCPNLWTALHSSYSQDFLKACIQRSKNHPLSLGITGQWRFWETEAILLPCAKRIQSIGYAGPEVDVFHMYTSALLDLKVVFQENSDGYGNDGNGTYHLPIPAGRPFRSLYLQGVSVTSCDWSRLWNLQTLELHNIVEPQHHFSANLLKALAASVGLRKLVVEGLGGDTENNAVDDENFTLVPITIHLPLLQSMSIRHSLSSFMIALLASLTTPNCSTIALGGRIPETLAWDWLAKNLCPGLRKAAKIEIQLSFGQSNLFCDTSSPMNDDWHLESVCRPDACADRLSIIGGFFKDIACATTFTLSVDCKQPYSNSWLFDVPISVLECFQDLVEITVGFNCEVASLLQRLAVIQNGEESWPCPKLQVVYMKRSRASTLYRKGFLGLGNARWEETWPEDNMAGIIVLKSRDVALSQSF